MRTLLVLASVLLAAGCGHEIAYTSLNAPPRPLAPRDPSSVELFVSSAPDRPYVEVGLFEIEQRTPNSDGTPEMFDKLRVRAAQIGCDALVVTASTDRVQSVSGQSFGAVRTTSAGMGGGYGHYSGMHYGSVNTVRGHRAACVVYKEPPPVAL